MPMTTSEPHRPHPLHPGAPDATAAEFSSAASSEHNIASLLAERAYSENTALITPTANGIERISYRELANTAAQVQRHLTRLGVREGDRVALSLPNVPLMPALYYGILAAGAICVPLNPLLSAAELEHHIADSGCTVLFTWEGTRLADEAPSTSCVTTGALHLEVLNAASNTPFTPAHSGIPAENEASELTPLPVSGSEPALILYTSGTTGKPKGATLTHENILSNAHSCVSVFDFTHQDTIFGGLPLFHAFGQTVCMNAALCAGAAIALLPRFTPAGALSLIESARVNVLAAVPSMYVALAAALAVDPDTAGRLYGRTRFGISGGSPLPEPAHRALKKLIGCPIYEGYGLSETSPVVCFNQEQFGLVIGSVGRVLPGVRVQVRDTHGAPVGSGERGQLWIAGQNVMTGYWNNPAATEDVFDGEWFASGDIACMDDQGNIYIVDRIKDMVLRNGYSIYPREIEDVLYLHPQVAAAAVIGVPDDLVGEEVVAVIIPNGQVDTGVLEGELDALARTRLAAYKHPRRYLFVADLPLGPTGKVLKRELRAQLNPE